MKLDSDSLFNSSSLLLYAVTDRSWLGEGDSVQSGGKGAEGRRHNDSVERKGSVGRGISG